MEDKTVLTRAELERLVIERMKERKLTGYVIAPLIALGIKANVLPPEDADPQEA